MQFLVPIDLVGNELRNALIHPLAADPASPEPGQVWFNTTDEVYRGFDGTAVIDFGAGGLSIDLAAGEIIYGDGSGNEVAGTPDAAGIVDKASAQTISGAKTFSSAVTYSSVSKKALINDSGVAFFNAPGHAQPTTRIGDNNLEFGAGGSTAPDVLLYRISAHVLGLGSGDSFRVPSDPVDNNDVARKAYVDARLAALVDSAPGTLDTLNELAAALGDDPNFATTITNALATKTGKHAETIGNGALTSIDVEHNFGTRDVVVSVHDAATYEEVVCDVTMTDVDTVTLGFAVAPAANSLRAVVIG